MTPHYGEDMTTPNPTPQDRLGVGTPASGATPELPIIDSGQPAPPLPVPVNPAGKMAHPPLPPRSEVAQSGSMVAIFGDVKRQGVWHSPEHQSMVGVFGDGLIDLREAQLEAQTIYVKSFLLFSDLKVIVPPEMDVVVEGTLVFGDRKVDRHGADPNPRTRVVVRADGAFADVKVKTLPIGVDEPKWWKKIVGS